MHAPLPDARFPRFVLYGTVLVLSVLAAYCQTLDAPFLFDDEPNIVYNNFLKIEELNRDTIAYVMKAPHPSSRRKLANLSFALNYLWCGIETHCYHLVNIGIHIVSGLLAFGFFYQLLGVGWLKQKVGYRRFWAAWSAAMLWALHPINLNAVTYIVQRMTSMSGMFGLFSLNCWLLARKSGPGRITLQAVAWTSAGFLFWVAGILSKENLILLPIMMLATEFFLFRRGEFRVPWRFLLVFFVATIAWLVFIDRWRFWEFFATRYASRDFTLIERMLTQGRVLWHYISLFFYPVADRFSLLYDYPVSRSLLSPPTTILSLIGWLLLPAFAAIHFKKRSFFLWIIAWFLSGHLLESTILPLEIIFEHRNYLPSLSLSLGTVWGGMLFADRVSLSSRKQFALFVPFLLIVGGATYTRNLDFKDAVTFYRRELEKFPESQRLRLNLAVTYNRSGDYGNGLLLLNALAEQYPEDITIHQNLFFFWSQVAGDEEKAMEIFSRIMNLIDNGHYVAGNDAIAVRSLARHLREKGEFAKAIVLVEKLLEDYSKLDSLWVLKGTCHAELDEWTAARDAFEKALSLRPDDYAIMYWYGRSLVLTGQENEGCHYLRRATLDPVREDTVERSKILYEEMCGEYLEPR